MTTLCRFLVSVSLFWLVLPASAEVRLPRIFSNGMVLQRDIKVPIWGWADPESNVSIMLATHEPDNAQESELLQSQTVTADAEGAWQAELEPLKPGKALRLRVRSGNELVVENILVGEVWLCSGQSNMAMTVSRAKDFEQEKAAANFPAIRMYRVGAGQGDKKGLDTSGNWSLCSPETVGGFTATGYFFARELHQALDVPIGLINSSVGGTPIENWIDAEAQRADPNLREFIAAQDRSAKEFDEEAARKRYEKQLEAWKETAKAAKAAGKPVPRAPRDPVAQFKRKNNIGSLYHSLVQPVIRYGFRGAIWYQGEANSVPNKAPYYGAQLSLLVQDWRKQHGAGNFPFAWVQLPNFAGNGRNWPVVREQMLQTLSVPSTGMAITVDVGESKDIHPKNKQAVGARLAQWARATVYGEDELPPMGPLVESVTFTEGTAQVKFQSGDELQLTETANDKLGVVVAGKDQVWHVAQLKVTGNTLMASTPKVPDPVAIRYGWANEPTVMITNTDGLPASPFRSDKWEDVAPFDQ